MSKRGARHARTREKLAYLLFMSVYPIDRRSRYFDCVKVD